MTLVRIAAELGLLAGELHAAAVDDTTAAECRALTDLGVLLEYVQGRLGEIAVEEDPRLLWIEEVCLCGHARGEHYVDAPHLCEGSSPAVFQEVPTMFAEWQPMPCPCRGFEAESAHRGDTLRTLVNVPSEPPPAAADEAP
jgi:hypothetical protein